MADSKNKPGSAEPADHKSVSGQSGEVAGSHSGQSKDQVPKRHAKDGGENLANQPVKVVSGRFSPPSHLDRTRVRK